MSKPLRVLIVEDLEDDALLVIRELERGGYDTTFEQVETAEAMTAALEKQSWDIIISDYRLPHFSAPEALELFLQSGLDLPFIVVSGTIGEETAVATMKAGAHDYLMKGNLKRLMPAIERELNEAEVRRQRRQAEEALRASEEKYRDIFENVSDFIYIHDLEGMFIETNLSFIEEMGYTEDDLANMNVRDLIPERYKPQFNDYLKEVIEKGKSEGLIRVLTKDGSERIVEYRNSIVYNSTGPIGVRSSARDITERKQAEEELLKSEQRYRTLFEDSIDAIVITSREGKLFDFNQAALDLLGYTKVEIMGMNFRELYVDPSNGKRFQQQIDQEGSVANFEAKLHKKDGTELDSLFTVNTKRADDGSIVGYQGFIRDITDQKKLEAQFRQAQKMEAIGALSGGIAHDFNNILAAIIGYAELIKMKLPEDSEFLPNLDQVLKSGNRAKSLVQQILAFSRKQELEQKPLHLKYIVMETLKLLRSTLPTDIEIKEDIAQDVGVVNADPTQMHQVIMNLCTNAGHAMQEEGGVLAVGLANVELDDIAAAQYLDMNPGPYLRLSVSDTGYGMTPDVRDRIFEPYFTTKDKGVGTGLGLSVVNGIVDSHGGTITVYSEPGKGSTFHVYLPLIQEEAIKPEMDEKALILTGNERILFIDDEPTLVELGTQMLERLGYEVTTRTSSIEALELFKAQPDRFDLVITDMTMPNMMGDKLAKELMKIRPDIPIIICTGFSERISEEKAKGMGIRAYAMKPLVMQDLTNTVRKVLNEK